MAGGGGLGRDEPPVIHLAGTCARERARACASGDG